MVYLCEIPKNICMGTYQRIKLGIVVAYFRGSPL